MNARYLEEVNFELSRVLGRPRTVLDVGCGAGQNGAIAKDRGARVTGVEAYAPSVAVARTRLDEVIEADIETDEATALLAGRTFEVLLFGDVLEHTKDPHAVLARFLPLLEEEGRVVISLPNVAAWPVRLGLLAGRFEYEDTGVLDSTHLRFFTRATAIRLAKAAGLEILDVGLNPMIVRAGLGLIKKAFAGGVGNPSGILDSSLYTAYLRYVRPVEGELADLLPGPFSFQTIVVARKPPRRRSLSLTVGIVSMKDAPPVRAVIDGIRTQVPEAEVLLVAGSQDETAELARSRGVRVVGLAATGERGPAMWRLLNEATTDVIVTMGCDGAYPTECIRELHRLVEEGADVVNTSRTRHRHDFMSLWGFVANRAFAEATRALHGMPTTDVRSEMRAYRTSVVRALDPDPNGDALLVDLIVLPARLGYRIVEIEIPYSARSAPSPQRFDSTISTFRRILRARAGHRARRDRYRNL